MFGMTGLPRALSRRVPVLIALLAVSATTGCVTVSSRVWYNGRAMTSSPQYYRIQAGDRSPATLRSLYYNSDAQLFGRHRSMTYPSLGPWPSP
jgi:hypothetical protein